MTTIPSIKQVQRLLLYRISPNGGVVFAEKSRAQTIGKIYSALRTAKTWRDLERKLDRDEFEEIMIGGFDDMGEDRPRGSEPFSADMVPGFSDGDYPAWLAPEMDYLLPRAFLSKFGRRESTVHNGTYWILPSCKLREMKKELSELNFKVLAAGRIYFC